MLNWESRKWFGFLGFSDSRIHPLNFSWIRSILVHSGDSLFLFPMLVILGYFGPSKYRSLFEIVLITIALTGIIVWIIKLTWKKQRPIGTYGEIYRKYDPYAFPSGHAARSWAIVSIIFGFEYFLSGLVLSIWAILVSLIRVKLRLHTYSDIFAGIITGVTIAICVLFISQS
jgi:membrane-associated phospholipid phosphatase